MGFRIIGTGSALPARVITNQELSESLDTSDEWISQRVGIRERRVCTTETIAELAFKAASGALQMSGTDPKTLDIIICATLSADHATPSLACSIQQMLGAVCPAMDVNAACSGFIYALETAAGFISRGSKKVLVVGGERLSRHVDWTDRSTAVIFGDGAGSVVLTDGDAYLSSKLFAQGNDEILRISRHKGSSPYYTNDSKPPYIHMRGQETFKFAVKAMCTDIMQTIEEAGLSTKDIAWVIPHQANARIIDAAAKKLEIDPERCLKNIDKVGNTSSASIPILLDGLCRSGRIKDGDYIVMCAFGGGLTSAACVIRWDMK